MVSSNVVGIGSDIWRGWDCIDPASYPQVQVDSNEPSRRFRDRGSGRDSESTVLLCQMVSRV